MLTSESCAQDTQNVCFLGHDCQVSLSLYILMVNIKPVQSTVVNIVQQYTSNTFGFLCWDCLDLLLITKAIVPTKTPRSNTTAQG
jgi:hypothetical protein